MRSEDVLLEAVVEEIKRLRAEIRRLRSIVEAMQNRMMLEPSSEGIEVEGEG